MKYCEGDFPYVFIIVRQNSGFVCWSLSEFGTDEPSDKGVSHSQLHRSYSVTVERREEDRVALVFKRASRQRIVNEFELASGVRFFVRKLDHHAHLAIKRCGFRPVVVFVPSVGAAVISVVFGELDLVEPGDVKTESVGVGLEGHTLNAVVERRQVGVGAGEPSHFRPTKMVIDDALASVPHSRGDGLVGQPILDEPLALFGSERLIE